MKKRSGHAPNFTRHTRQQGEVPPVIAVPISASITNLHSTPNYMKSTASADARREQANVKRNNPQTALDVTNSSKNVTETLAEIKTLITRNASFKPERTLVKKSHPDVLGKNLQVERVTCSSTLKGCEPPDYLKLSCGGTELEGTSGVKVCSYSRCSLNGHGHALLPPLKSFVSARRKVLKTERSIKQRCQSPTERPTRGSRNCAKLIGRDVAATSKSGEMCCDIENLEQNGYLNSTDLNSTDAVASAHVHHVHEKYHDVSPQYSCPEAKNKTLEQQCIGSMPNVNLYELDPQSSDMDREKGKHYPTYLVDDYECNPMMEEEFGEEGDEVSEESFDEDSLNKDLATEMTTAFVDIAPCKAIKHDQDHVKNGHNQAEIFDGVSTKNLTKEPYPGFSNKNSSEAECNVAREVNSRNMEMPETEDRSSIQATTKYEKSNQDADGVACFNPHEVHFLPLESDPEAEKVNLRHQEQEARRKAEEWMVDYALREAVTKIGRARERKVTTLVEAFERVLQTSKS